MQPETTQDVPPFPTNNPSPEVAPEAAHDPVGLLNEKIDPNRTINAQQAFAFGDVFAYKFDAASYGPRSRKLRLVEPDGPSTAGGKQARQSLVLEGPDGESRLVVGWVDVPAKQAELRSYNVICNHYVARYGSSFETEAEDYDRMLRDVRSLLKHRKIEPSVVEAAVGPQPRVFEPEPQKSGVGVMAMAVLAVAVGLGAGYVIFGG